MSITVKDDKVTIKVIGGIGPQGPAGPAGSGGTGGGAISSINGQTGTITITSAGGVTASGGSIAIGSPVQSVAGRTGVVTLSTADVSGYAAPPVTSVAGRTGAVTIAAADVSGLSAAASAAAPVQSVAGRTGAVTLVKADVGLGSVDNTADASKPVSTAQAAADAAVQAYAVQRGNHTGTQAVGTITGLGGAATLSVGTTAGTVAAGDDSRIVGALSTAAAATTYQPLDSDLTSIAALSTTTFGRSLLTQADAVAARTTIGLGSLATQSGTFSGTSSGTNTGDQTIAVTGDVTGSGTGSFVATLAASGVTAGTYTSVTVDAKGRVTAGTNPAAYSLPTASSTVLGGIKIGSGLSIDGSGVVTASGGSTANVSTTPTTLSADTNNWSIGTGDIFRISASAAVNVTGIAAGTSGQTALLVNVGSFAITLKHGSTSSSSANRFTVPWAGDCVLAASGGNVVIYYDSTSATWRVVA